MDQLFLTFLNLEHQIENSTAVGADQHVQGPAVLGDVGGTAHLDRQTVALPGPKWASISEKSS
jgi:hypothetical protein